MLARPAGLGRIKMSLASLIVSSVVLGWLRPTHNFPVPTVRQANIKTSKVNCERVPLVQAASPGHVFTMGDIFSLLPILVEKGDSCSVEVLRLTCAHRLLLFLFLFHLFICFRLKVSGAGMQAMHTWQKVYCPWERHLHGMWCWAVLYRRIDRLPLVWQRQHCAWGP